MKTETLPETACEKGEKTEQGHRYCSLRPMIPVDRPAGLEPFRLELIGVLWKKWVNGTILHYYFFDKESDGEFVRLRDGRREFRTWVGSATNKERVREAFQTWAEVGIGVKFVEVDNREEAEVRIGFMMGDGSWSYVGRDILRRAQNQRTMNLGWDVSNDIDTAIHEIGHTLGFSHEHQNPNAGIVWNEEAVYAALAAPPNNWNRSKTYDNIIKKLNPNEVNGSDWDPNSIMHYPFEAGLIKRPEGFRQGLHPTPGLSELDRQVVRQFYPPMEDNDLVLLRPFDSEELHLSPGQQADFSIHPEATRKYTIQTFGQSDTVMVLFEEVNGEPFYVSGDDDSGTDFNSKLNLRLVRGKKYILRIRLYYSGDSGRTAVMVW